MATHQEKNKWIVMGITALGVILTLTTWFSATAIIPDLQDAFNLNASELAWLTNGVQAGFVVGALSASILSLADVVRPQRLMACSALCAGLANAIILLEPGTTWIIVSRFLTGIALSGVYPPAMKFIASWFIRGRGLAMGTMVGALTLGSALPHFIRAVEFGFDWQSVIVVSTLGCIVGSVIFIALLQEGPHKPAPAKVNPRQLGRMLRDRPVMLANLGYFGHMWELYAMWAWFLSYAIAAKQSMVSDWNASVLTFCVVALGAPSCVIAGVVADKIGRSLTTAGCMIISGSCAILIGVFFDGPAWLFFVVAIIWGFTVVADSAQFSASVSENADTSFIGTALAFQMGVGFAITIFVVWLMPHLANIFGSWRWTFSILALGPFVGTWSMLKLYRYEKSRM
ncbi:MFS transporter [Lentilitoribacter sp. EG35]|uniref:MFS transporter n=1 Tax=Lentilitoribacter sp. EG35 TaxID=3234192 RepID=UPI003460E5F8